MVYINFRNHYDNNCVETIDQFETLKEARVMLKEYNMIGDYSYYISSRPTKEWREDNLVADSKYSKIIVDSYYTK